MIVWIALAVAILGGAIGGGLYWIDQQDIEDPDDTDTDDDGDDEGDDGTDWLLETQQYIDRGRRLAARAWARKPDNMAARSLDAAAGTETKRARWRMAGAVAIVLGTVVAMTYVAGALNGTVAGVAFIVAAVLGIAALPLSIMVFRDGMPLGGLVGTGLAVAAQIAFGRAALVRRDDGRFEWTALRETDEGYVAALEDGRAVPIDADDGWVRVLGSYDTQHVLE